jgi:hypothetical protein
MLCVQLWIYVFARWINREYIYNLASDTVLHQWKYRQTVHYIQVSMECIHWYIPVTMRTIPLFPSTVHYLWVYRRNVSVSIFQRLWELFSFSLTLFMVFITYKYTDKMCPSVYSSDYGNCSLSPWHCSRCSLHTNISTECFCGYISETMRIVPLLSDTVHGVH